MRRLPPFSAGLCLTLLLSIAAAAQTGKTMSTGEITGQVRLENDTPAPDNTLVSLDRSDSGAVSQVKTDAQGKFLFRGLDPMPYRITVRLPGYETSQTDVDLQFISHTYVQIKLRPLPGSLHKADSAEAVSARDLQIPAAAVSEFNKGKKELTESNNPAKAIPHFSKAVHIYDRFTQAYVLLGVASGAEKKWAEARSAFNKAIETDATTAAAYVGLGAIQNNEKDFSGAEKSLLKALELDSQSADAHLELARAYWAMGRWQDAEPHAAKVVLLKPDNPGGHIVMGNILLRKRDNIAALREYQEALRLAPNSPLAPSIREVVNKIEAAMHEAKH